VRLLLSAQTSTGDTLRAVRVSGGAISTIRLPHAIDRIEPMGSDAVVIGTGSGSLHFTGIDLSRDPRVAQRFVVPGASQGELRRHRFFYRKDGPSAGTLGLPIRESSRPGFAHLIEESASIVFVRHHGREFTGLGNLVPKAPRDTAGGCAAPCPEADGSPGRLVAIDFAMDPGGHKGILGHLHRHGGMTARNLAELVARLRGPDGALLVELDVSGSISTDVTYSGQLAPYAGGVPFATLYSMVLENKVSIVVRTDLPGRDSISTKLGLVHSNPWGQPHCS
jgi:hypothetical protein